jgi:hypothetical protein
VDVAPHAPPEEPALEFGSHFANRIGTMHVGMRGTPRLIVQLIAAGTAARIVLAFTTRGVEFDIQSFELVRYLLDTAPGHVYTFANATETHWPYPPGFFPWIMVSGWLADLTGLRFDGFIQLAPIACDAALAWICQEVLRRGGASVNARALAAGLVAFGPVFFMISGFHGQIDSVAILPALLAVLVWDRMDPGRRALVAGLLIGVGASIKTFPIVMLVALWPTARSFREAATVTAVAGGVLALAPWLIADFDGTFDGVRANRGVPGMGGISLLVQPDLAAYWLGVDRVAASPLSLDLYDNAIVFAVLTIAGVAALALWKRLDALTAAVLVWLALWAFGVNFAFQYAVWGLPFLIASGRLRSAAIVQAVLAIPLFLMLVRIWRDVRLDYVYTPIMIAAWAGALAWVLAEVSRVAGRPPEHPR